MDFLELKERLALRRNANFSALGNIHSKRYGNNLNEAQRALLRMPGMALLRQTTTTKASVAGTQSYTVLLAAKINRIWETTNDTKLTMRTLAWLRQQDPDPQQATPCVWIPTAITGTSQTFLLWPTPSAVITYTLDILSPITDMAENTDEPALPEDFHDLLIDMAEIKEVKKSDDPDRYAMLSREIGQGQKDLKSWITGHPDWSPPMNGATDMGISRLGAWYPSGS